MRRSRLSPLPVEPADGLFQYEDEPEGRQASRLYANVYYTTDGVLANHGDVLVRFFTGSARGWGYAREHPEAAVDHLVSEYGNLSCSSELEPDRARVLCNVLTLRR